MKFFIVDAFTDKLFGGNPAGVVFLEREEFPSEEIMLQTAAELRYSETAFIRTIGDKFFHTRYFTPEAEVDLCGHATIACFYVLIQLGILSEGSTCKNQTQAGELNIEVKNGEVLMDMGDPVFIKRLDSEEAMKELYMVMGLSDTKCPVGGLYPELISTGLPDIMMPVPDQAALEKIAPDFPALSALSEKYEVVGVHAFTLGGKTGTAHCRNFAPRYAIDEEAATGTSNGALTYYLYRNGLIKEGAQTLFIQGEAMNRPSKIRSHITEAEGVATKSTETKSAESKGKIQIRVGGSAVILAEGTIYL